MKTIEHPHTSFQAPLLQPLRIRWSAAVTKWSDHFGACEGDGRRQAQVAVVLELLPRTTSQGVINVWVEAGERRQSVLKWRVVSLQSHADADWYHLDAYCQSAGEICRILALSFAAPDRLMFAQSPFLDLAGFRAGGYDPPTLHRTTTEAAIPSA